MDSYETILFPGGGKIRIHHLVSKVDTDYAKLFSIAECFALDGKDVTLVPKMKRPHQFEYYTIYNALKGTPYDGKCPDMLVDGKWYEYEGFITANPKRAFSNMLNRGLKQSDRIIIDWPNMTDAYMKRVIHQRVFEGQQIEEVWILEGYNLRLLYKKSGEQSE